MSINYHRLFVPGLDARTSTIAEVSHRTIKYGDFNVGAGMTTTTSCNRQCTKTELRALKLQKEYAQIACKNVVQKDSQFRSYLTPWAAALAEEQFVLKNDYWIVQQSPTKFILMKPTTKKFEKLKKMNELGKQMILKYLLIIDDAHI